MKGPPRFFCDNCGSEVPFDQKRCPRCSRYFSSIRCPHCGFVGDDALFADGCPVCGYSASRGGEPGGKGAPSKSFQKAGALPVWVYLLTAAALVGVVMVLIKILY